MLLVSILVAIVILSFVPSTQGIFEKLTFGLVKRGLVPWLGLAAVFAWSERVAMTPTVRGALFGIITLGIAVALSWWAPRNPNVKGIIQNAFFGGRDIWSLPDYKMYVGVLWGAGLMLAIPLRQMDMLLNVVAILAMLVWFGRQAYKGNSDKKTPDSKTNGVPDSA